MTFRLSFFEYEQYTSTLKNNVEKLVLFDYTSPVNLYANTLIAHFNYHQTGATFVGSELTVINDIVSNSPFG